MKFNYIIFVLGFLYSSNTLSQQNTIENATQIKELKIGDRVPDIQLSILKDNKINDTLSSKLQAPLVIFDFWDTYCTSCIEAMPKLYKLQQDFNSKITILPVTYQNASVIGQFFTKNRFLKELGIKLPSVINDKLLRQYFKHKTIPHVVWIYKGVVKAITTSEYLNSENIKDILDGNDIKWPIKNDFLIYDYSKPLFSNTSNGIVSLSSFKSYAFVTDYINNIPRKSGFVTDTVRKTVRDYIYNYPIIQAYFTAMNMITPLPFSTAPNRMILEVKDLDRYIFNSKNGYENDWDLKNSICFESLIADSTSSSNRGKKIVQQLNLLLGLNGRIEKRKMKCLIIVRSSMNSFPKPIKNAFFKDRTLKNLIEWLDVNNLITNQYPPVVDESNYSNKLSLGKWNDILSLRNELKKQGFEIKEGVRELNTFVLTEIE